MESAHGKPHAHSDRASISGVIGLVPCRSDRCCHDGRGLSTQTAGKVLFRAQFAVAAWYFSCFTHTAHAMRASLFASAQVALLWLVRSWTASAQARSRSTLRPARRATLAARRTERAPWVSSMRM